MLPAKGILMECGIGIHIIKPIPIRHPCPKLRHSHASPLGTCGVTTKIRQAEIGKLTLAERPVTTGMEHLGSTPIIIKDVVDISSFVWKLFIFMLFLSLKKQTRYKHDMIQLYMYHLSLTIPSSYVPQVMQNIWAHFL